jgi:hypothetical protein
MVQQISIKRVRKTEKRNVQLNLKGLQAHITEDFANVNFRYNKEVKTIFLRYYKLIQFQELWLEEILHRM